MKKKAIVFLCLTLALLLAACGSKDQGVAISGGSIDINDIALRPDGAAGRIYESGGYKLLIPLEYYDFVIVNTSGDSGVLFSVAEKASVEAAKKQGIDDDGAGFLFAIGSITEGELKERRCRDMSGQQVFARDDEGNCWMLYHPTDVRLVREDYGNIPDEDMGMWSALNEWARETACGSFIAENSGLSALTYGNSAPEMYLARAAYQPGAYYTVSTLEFGPLSPDGVDAAPYVERLTLGAVYEYADAGETPDGEYAVLAFPDDECRFDFFFAEGGENYVRQVNNDGMEILYKASFDDPAIKASTVMQEWYSALVQARGLAAEG